MEAFEGKSIVCNPVFCRNDANELPCWRDSFASIHRIISWFICCSSVMNASRSSRFCCLGLRVVIVVLVDAMYAAWRRYEVSGPALRMEDSGTL